MRNKILSLLVLLLTAASGAWAKTDPNAVYWTNETWAGWAENVTTHTVGDITITCSGNAKAYEWAGSGEPLAMEAGANDAITFTSNGKPFKSIKIQVDTNADPGIAGWTWVGSWTIEWSGTPSTSVTLSGCDIKADVITFTFGTAEAPITVEPVEGKTNEWTFSMPASDVVLTPQYAPKAQWAKVENVDQLPTAIEGIYAGTTDAIVKAGTVAKIGETENLQGTLMYAVGTSATEQPALTAFSATLPTAKDITTAGDVWVWYYIQGADTPQGQTATAENTFNDSEICTTPLKVTVLSDKFDIQFKAANANTIEAGKATVTVGGKAATVTEGKLEGVKMGSEVKVTAKEGYKFRKVEVKKRPEFVPGATIQNIESFVEVENNRDGTITLHMPTLNPSTYNVTNSSYLSNGEHTLHFGYEIGSGTDMSVIGTDFNTRSGWSDHTPFSELDKTIDITSGKPRVAILITGHVQSATCPAPDSELFWGLYRYTNPVKVTYNLGGGSVSGSTADKVEYLFSGDALATTFAAPTREGYTFDGWYTSAEGGTKLTASNATSATTIYAHWNAIAE